MIAQYSDNGFLKAVLDEDRRLIAVLIPDSSAPEGMKLHPEYNTPEAQAAIALFPLFDPDKVVIEPTEPNWAGFRQQITTDSAYLRIVTANATTQALNTALNGVLWRVGEDAGLMPEVAGIWNAIAALALQSSSDEAIMERNAREIEALNAIAANNDIPLQLNELGLIR